MYARRRETLNSLWKRFVPGDVPNLSSKPNLGPSFDQAGARVRPSGRKRFHPLLCIPEAQKRRAGNGDEYLDSYSVTTSIVNHPFCQMGPQSNGPSTYPTTKKAVHNLARFLLCTRNTEYFLLVGSQTHVFIGRRARTEVLLSVRRRYEGIQVSPTPTCQPTPFPPRGTLLCTLRHRAT